MLADYAHMEDCSEEKTVFIPMRMEQLTREHDVHFYTGLKVKANEKFEAYLKRLNVILSQPCWFLKAWST